MPYIATIQIQKETTEYKTTTVEEVVLIKVRGDSMGQVIGQVHGHINMLNPKSPTNDGVSGT